MRYLIGIDLGTTNTALAYVDTLRTYSQVQIFPIPQLVGLGQVGSLHTLPSYGYVAGPDEWPRGSLKLPWKEERESFVGHFAKIYGGKVPTRSVHSAKSWLCNPAANRKDKILPLDCGVASQKISPVEASAAYLIHLRDAWNSVIAKGNPNDVLEEQEIVLTVPASFDEVARSLTIQAARSAGFRHLTLLEEPQAAFYSWISHNETSGLARFRPGETILVCDVGGGTTDFSLIEVIEQAGVNTFQRMAVGDHLLLGGDNMDAALAHLLEKKMIDQGTPALEFLQWQQLTAGARDVKEELFERVFLRILFVPSFYKVPVHRFSKEALLSPSAEMR